MYVEGRCLTLVNLTNYDHISWEVLDNLSVAFVALAFGELTASKSWPPFQPLQRWISDYQRHISGSPAIQLHLLNVTGFVTRKPSTFRKYTCDYYVVISFINSIYKSYFEALKGAIVYACCISYTCIYIYIYIPEYMPIECSTSYHMHPIKSTS